MFDTTIKNILSNIWPMVVIITVILSSLRIIYLIRSKEKTSFYDEIIKLGFILYIIILFYVVTFQDVSWSTSNFIPFKEIFRYQLFSSSFYRNVMGNLFMFLPYGFFVSYFLKIDKKKIVIFMSLLVSLTIEITQLIIGRVFDVDDIMLNVCGGLIGYYIYRLICKYKVKNNCFYNIGVIIIMILATIYLLHVLEVI